MIELKNNRMHFSFPEVHPDAKLAVEFQRTLRIPDDGNEHFLPPGLGNFPLRHVDDFAEDAPEDWMTRGGVMLPMYQSEALWINFRPTRSVPRQGGGGQDQRGDRQGLERRTASRSAGLPRRPGPTVARRLLREARARPPIRGDAPGLRLQC